jgi:hypothetical protein
MNKGVKNHSSARKNVSKIKSELRRELNRLHTNPSLFQAFTVELCNRKLYLAQTCERHMLAKDFKNQGCK